MSKAIAPTNVQWLQGEARSPDDLLRFCRCTLHLDPGLIDAELLAIMGKSKTRGGAALRLRSKLKCSWRANHEVVGKPGIKLGGPWAAPGPEGRSATFRNT